MERLAKEIEAMQLNAITTTEISYKISLARKNLIQRNMWWPLDMETKVLDECFKEIRHQLQLRSRGRK